MPFELSRRLLLQQAACGFGALALHDIVGAAENPLAQRILNGEFGPGDTITVDAHDLGLSFEK